MLTLMHRNQLDGPKFLIYDYWESTPGAPNTVNKLNILIFNNPEKKKKKIAILILFAVIMSVDVDPTPASPTNESNLLDHNIMQYLSLCSVLVWVGLVHT